MKYATNIRIDLFLIPVFIVLIASGVGIHVTDGMHHHDLWHTWAVIHVVSAILFITLGILHIKGHWSWFKSLTHTLRKKSKPTIILTILFLFETISGIILLLFTEGGGSHTGLWHWWAGLLMTVFGTGHLLKRWKRLTAYFAAKH